MKFELPKEVTFILKTLNNNHNGYGEGLLVGGCIRDMLLKRKPKDYDFATNLDYSYLKILFKDFSPKEMGEHFGVLQIKVNDTEYEIAKFRSESDYVDNRHPSSVMFTSSFKEDAKRRDFTINSFGYDGKDLIDYFNGIEDLDNKVIQCVGNPIERFKEDALRMLRAVRFASQLGFKIETNTMEGIFYNRHLLYTISKERIREELNKILISDNPEIGLYLLRDLKLFNYIIPEVVPCIDFQQNNMHHHSDVFTHIVDVVKNTEPILINRLSALFHDIAKPSCYSVDETGEGHFYEHEKESSIFSEKALKNLKYDTDTIEKVSKIICRHMNKNQRQTDKSIKKLINYVGEENLETLFDLMQSDIKAHNPPHNFKGLDDLKLRCKEFIEREEPVRVSQLCINGNNIMEEFSIKQGKQIGEILNICLEYVLDNPNSNNKKDIIDYIRKDILSNE